MKFLDTQIDYYTKFKDLSKFLFEKKGKKLIANSIEINSNITLYFYTKLNEEFIFINRVFFFLLFTEDFFSIEKNELELKRLEVI
jgi:hypothetical protein